MVETLLKKFPVEDRTLFDAQCLSPLNRTRKSGADRASRLAEDLIDAIGEENAMKLFGFNNDITKHSMMDELKHQYKLYQLEKLPDDFHKLPATDGKKRSGRSQHSYWKEAYGQLQIDITKVENENIGIDEYWYKVSFRICEKLFYDRSNFHIKSTM